MRQLSELVQQRLGSNPATTGDAALPSSTPASAQPKPPNEHQIAAAAAARRLFNLLPPLDVSDPRAFMSMTAAMFAKHPAETWERATQAIVAATSRPTLDVIGKALATAFEPIERAWERQRALESHRRGLPPPAAERTAEEQARVDAQVEQARRIFPPTGKRGIW